MSNSLVRPSKSPVNSYFAAMERAREKYLAATKRAEANYFEEIKRAMEVFAGEPETVNGQAPQQQPEPQQTAA